MSNLSKATRERLLKTAAVLTAVSAAVSLSALALAPFAGAAVPSDYGLKEGNTISASGSSDPDVYIVNDWGYKRLFLNPAIFGFYGHLGGFAKVKSVSVAARDAFPTSGLFRNCETNDQKVYGVETTGEDTGVLHWVNTTGDAAVAADANFFKKVFCINNREFSWYSQSSAYTSVSQVPNYSRVAGAPAPGATPAPVAGAVNVSLASDNPGAASLTGKANGVVFMKLNLSGSGTLSSLKVYRKGPGATGDFANVYLYDGARRLTSGRTPSSSDGSVTFGSLNIAVNGSKTLAVVADLSSSGATAGNVNYFAVLSASDVVLSSGTVGGSFPVNGSNMTVTGQNGGTLTVDKSSSLTNPNAGQSGVQLSEFKLTAATEGAKISRVQMIQGGSIQTSAITNLRLNVSGVDIATASSLTSDGYLVFDLSAAPYVLAKGDNRIFKVFGDLSGKKADTIILYFENTADVLSIGDQFGFGMSITNNMGTTGTAHTLTLQGGIVTLSFIGPAATNVSTTSTKTRLLDFDVNSAANIEVRKTAVVLCLDQQGNGYSSVDDPATASLSAGFNDINNVAIIDRDTGTTLVGPADGTAFTTKSSSLTGGTATDCGTGTAGYAKTFTDTYNMTAGQTRHLSIVGDLKQSNTGAGGSIMSGAQMKALLFGYGNLIGSSGDVTIMKYTGTSTAVTNVDTVPSGNIAGNNMTVQGSSITLALSANPASGNHKFVKGTNGVNANGFAVQAALGNPVTVTKLTLTGYSGSAAASLTQGSSNTPGLLINAIRLVDGDTGAVISSAPTTNNLSLTTGTGAGAATFSNLNWAIPGGTTKNLLVKTDLSTNSPGTNNIFAFDINATDDVVGVDMNSNTVNAGNKRVNGATSATAMNATTFTTVVASGSLATSLAADAPPPTTPVYWGQNGTPMSKVKFHATNEGFYITRLTLYNTASSSDLGKNVDSGQISYTNKAGATLTSSGAFNNAGSLSLSFTDSSGSGGVDARPYVPKDGDLFVNVNANLKTGATLFLSRPGGIHLGINLSGNTNNDFQAVGEGSGATKQGTDISTVTGNSMVVFRSFPVFTVITPAPATTVAVGQDVLKFKIDALGSAADGATVFFDGATAGASGSLNFAIVASGEGGTTTLGFDLRRVFDGTSTVDQLVATRSFTSADGDEAAGYASSASFRFRDVSANQAVNIPAGQSNTFVLRLNSVTGLAKGAASNTGRPADYVQVKLKGAEPIPGQTSIVRWTDNSGTDRNHNVGAEAGTLRNLPMTGDRVTFK